jgi:hypothetical protein
MLRYLYLREAMITHTLTSYSRMVVSVSDFSEWEVGAVVGRYRNSSELETEYSQMYTQARSA